jgi:competence ComEA-like helix-hairpin-helix protein
VNVDERRGASILLLVLAATVGARAGLIDRGRSGGFTEDPGIVDSLLVASAAALEDADRRSRPLAAGETLDPNRAEAWELDRLLGVGPALAEAIVSDRDGRGAYRSIDELDRIPGIGPATLARLRPHLALGPVIGSARSAAGRGPRSERDRTPSGFAAPRVDLDRAGPSGLQEIPGVGPALARRIVEFRRSGGSFRSASDLERIRGIGPETAARIWAYATGKSNS